MTDSQSISVFKCPTCGAPLDPTPGMAAMKCPYCNSSVVIPETLRGIGSFQSSASSDAPASLSDVTRLAKEGKLEEAAKIYSKITGLNSEYAMMSVKSMAGIRDDEPMRAAPAAPAKAPPAYSPGSVIFNPPQTASSPGEPLVVPSAVPAPSPRRRNRSCLGGIINIVVLIAILISAFPSIIKSLPFELPSEFPVGVPFLTPGAATLPDSFAVETVSFTVSGLGDPRAIGVDGNGNIVVCDFEGGDIQVYDQMGNLISSFTPESNRDDLYITNIAVSRAGVIYIPADTILTYDINGDKLGEIGGTDDPVFFGYQYVALGVDDTLYAATDDAILRFDGNGQVDLQIPVEAVEERSDLPLGHAKIALDAQGNIYIWGSFDASILKFSPTGEFLSKFGGENTESGFVPGKFVNPHQIAFDAYGRMYVVDFFNIQVFDADGNYIDKIEPGYYGAAFDAQNNLYATAATDDKVVKFEVQSPGGE
ncbi:MAG: hypothetical protein KPEEDBHJ_03555 [Anaerolineales bacterium]|nr:hypothetical protein [Anaerolineales bacterium]